MTPNLTNPFEALVSGESDPFVLSNLQLDLAQGHVRGAVHYRSEGRLQHSSQTIELDRLERCDPYEGEAEQALELNERYLQAIGRIGGESDPAATAAPAPRVYQAGHMYRFVMANGSRYEGTVVGVREGQRTLILIQLAANGSTIALAEPEITNSEPL
jgi:hypothetical protein